LVSSVPHASIHPAATTAVRDPFGGQGLIRGQGLAVTFTIGAPYGTADKITI
jgi:hypothetical protein